MAQDNPPVRLAADPNTPEALRGLVNHARSDVPDASVLAKFGARLDTAIATNISPPTVELPSSLASGVTASKPLGIALGVMLSGMIAGGVWFGSRGDESPALGVAVSAQHVAIPVAQPDTLAPIVEKQAPLPDAATSSEPAANKPPASNAKTNSPTSTQSATDSEAALLLSARAALATDAHLALQRTKEHARRFPKGNLIQEREVIAIEALRRLGQTDAAQKRGAAFEQKYPDSAHRSKVEQTLQGK